MTSTRAPDRPFTDLVLSMDDLDWTRHWLPSRNRCDRLVLRVRHDGQNPQVLVRAIESKSSQDLDPIPLNPRRPPFDKGIEQVIATLDAVRKAYEPDPDASLVEDLRFASLIEHLASVALGRLIPIRIEESDKRALLRVLSEFSERKLDPEAVAFEGFVVCTHTRAAVPCQAAIVELEGDLGVAWPVHLVRCGRDEIDAVLGHGTWHDQGHVTPQLEPEFGLPHGEAAQTEQTAEVEGRADESAAASESAEPPRSAQLEAGRDTGSAPAAAPASEEPSVEVSQLAHSLYLVCRDRRFPVEEPEPEAIEVGPTLISVSMPLEAGASMRPITAALGDLAREMGVPSVEVENDPGRPYHLRFLVARTDREFPALPEPSPFVDLESTGYGAAYLGQTLRGEDYLSHLSSWPHLLVAGTTGSGKTTFLRSLLRQWNAAPANQLTIIVIDGKGEVDYFDVVDDDHFPASYPGVLLGFDRVLEVLEWLVGDEIPRRRSVLREAVRRVGPRTGRELFVDAIVDGSEIPFSPIVLFVDEFAELMIQGGSAAAEFETRLQQVAQAGRSTLVHLVLATQRPDANVLSGAVKTNLPARVALQLPTHHDSQTVLGSKGAESLLGRGDLLFRAPGIREVRLQGYST